MMINIKFKMVNAYPLLVSITIRKIIPTLSAAEFVSIMIWTDVKFATMDMSTILKTMIDAILPAMMILAKFAPKIIQMDTTVISVSPDIITLLLTANAGLIV